MNFELLRFDGKKFNLILKFNENFDTLTNLICFKIEIVLKIHKKHNQKDLPTNTHFNTFIDFLVLFNDFYLCCCHCEKDD